MPGVAAGDGSELERQADRRAGCLEGHVREDLLAGSILHGVDRRAGSPPAGVDPDVRAVGANGPCTNWSRAQAPADRMGARTTEGRRRTGGRRFGDLRGSSSLDIGSGRASEARSSGRRRGRLAGGIESMQHRCGASPLSRRALRGLRSPISAGSRTMFEWHPAARLLAARQALAKTTDIHSNARRTGLGRTAGRPGTRGVASDMDLPRGEAGGNREGVK